MFPLREYVERYINVDDISTSFRDPSIRRTKNISCNEFTWNPKFLRILSQFLDQSNTDGVHVYGSSVSAIITGQKPELESDIDVMFSNRESLKEFVSYSASLYESSPTEFEHHQPAENDNYGFEKYDLTIANADSEDQVLKAQLIIVDSIEHPFDSDATHLHCRLDYNGDERWSLLYHPLVEFSSIEINGHQHTFQLSIGEHFRSVCFYSHLSIPEEMAKRRIKYQKAGFIVHASQSRNINII